jgi:hypothetical protein
MPPNPTAVKTLPKKEKTSNSLNLTRPMTKIKIKKILKRGEGYLASLRKRHLKEKATKTSLQMPI